MSKEIDRTHQTLVAESATRSRAYAKALRYKERELRELCSASTVFGTLGPLRLSDPLVQSGFDSMQESWYQASMQSMQGRTAILDPSIRNPMHTLESLVTLYTKLQMPEAATGVLRYAEKQNLKPEASW